MTLHTTIPIASRYDFQQNTAILPTVLLDSEGHVVYANQAFCEWLQMSYAQILYLPIEEVAGKSLPKEVKKNIASSTSDTSCYDGEWLEADGSVWAYYSMKRLNIVENGIYEIQMELKPNSQKQSGPPHVMEEQLHLLATLPWGVLVVEDLVEYTKVLWSNPVASRIFGSKQHIESEVHQLLSSGEMAKVLAIAHQESSRIGSSTIEITRFDGKELSLSVAVLRICFEGKEAYALYIHDLSPERYYTQQLADKEEALLTLAKSGKIGQWRYNLRTKSLHWSKEVFTLLGIDCATVAPSPKLLAERMHPEDLQKLVCAIEDAIQKRKQSKIDLRIFSEEGKAYRLRTELEYAYDITKQASWIKGTIQDETKISALEEQVHQLKKSHQIAHKIAKIGLWEWELADGKLLWTEEFANICGWSLQKQSGNIQDFINIIYPSERDKVAALLQEMPLPEKAFHCTILLDGGDKKNLFVRYQVVATHEGKPIKATGIIHDVTESKQIEQDLRYHEYLFQNVTDAIISTNIQMRIKTWNSAAEKIYGWKAADVIGKRLKDVLFSGVNPQLFEGMSSELIRTGEWKGILRQGAKNNQELVIQSSAHLLKDSEGYLVGLVMVNRDLTDFIRIEQEAFKNQQMLDMVFDNMPGYIYWVDKKFTLLGCNPSFSKHIGINIHEDLNRVSLQDIAIDAQYQKEAMAHIQQVFETKMPMHIECQHMRFQGKERWLRTNYVPIKNLQAEVVGVLSSSDDITDSMLFQQEMESHRVNLSAMVEHAGYALCYVDTDFFLKAFNNSFASFHEESFGVELNREMNYLQNLPPNWKEQIEEVFIYVIAGNSVSTERCIIMDGQHKWFEMTCNPVTNQDTCLGLFFSVRDITQRKINEKQQLDDKLKEEQMRSLAVIQGQEEERKRVSMELHDGVGQILTALQMQSSFLKDKTYQDPEVLGQQLQKVITLVQDAKQEIRRISFNLMPSMLSDFGLGPSIEQLCHMLFTPANIYYEAFITLEEERFDVAIESGIFRIAQEIFNNATKYSHARKVVVKLGIIQEPLHDSIENEETHTSEIKTKPAVLQFSVNDDGIGISPENLVVFQQKGHGLSNIKQRVSLLNGFMSIKADKGAGVSYFITIPL